VTLAARKIRLLMQLRRAGIADTAVLAALERVPREMFVPHAFRDQAYENVALPIGQGQTLSQPEVVAQMTAQLAVDRSMTVLEIGTGSGYQAAILARLARRVYTIERHKELLDEAEARFGELRLTNVVSRLGDGSRGWPEPQSFPRIIVTCAAALPPEPLLEQLRPGGVMLLPVGETGRQQELLKLEKTETGVRETRLGLVRFVPLVSEPSAAAGGRSA
jgi:protein-L-isoaspartate(D-aspartate) O-methyltransferase